MLSTKLATPFSEVESKSIPGPASVRELYEGWNIQSSVPVVAFRDGQVLLRKDWDDRLEDGHVDFIMLPQGGDGQDKSILRTVAMIGLTIAAGSIAFPEAWHAWQVAAARTAVAVTGAFLINEIIPIVTEDPSTEERKSLAKSSTYSISARGNRARLLEPIPAIYGRHQYFPDYVSQPYGEYENNAQVLYQHYSLGVVPAEIEKLAFGGVAIWENGNVTDELDDVEVEFVGAGDTSQLYPETNVTSSSVSGFDVQFKKTDNLYDITGGTIARITIDSASGGGTDLEESLSIWDVGDIVRIVDITGVGANGGSTGDNVRYEVVAIGSQGDWIEVQSYDGSPSLTTESNQRYILDAPRDERFVGPFPASDAGEDLRSITVNVAFPRGLYRLTQGNTVTEESVVLSLYAQRIDDAGDPILRDGSAAGVDEFILAGNLEFRDTATNPLFRTLKYTLEYPGRYEVRLVREDREQGLVDNRYADTLVWQTLGGVLDTDTNYDIDTLVVKIRATNQLSESASERLSVTQTAVIPVYNQEDQQWTPQPTQNPVWAALDMLRNEDYGAGVEDSRLDLDTFLYYAQLAEDRQDTFNAVFDTKRSLWESVGYALRSMRSSPILLGDTYSMIRDEDQAVPKAVLTPRTIVHDSLSTTHQLFDDESPDHVIVEYLDERYWEAREVECLVDEDSPSETPARIRLFGVTDRDQAYREGVYYARTNKYRRILVALETELDGRVLLRGDKVLVSHDVPQWGQSTEALSYDAGSRILEVTDELIFDPSASEHVLSLRKPDGGEYGPIIVTQVTPTSVQFDAISLAAQSGSIDDVLVLNNVAREPNKVIFGTSETYAKEFVVTDVRPRGLDRVQVALANYDSRIGLDPGQPPDEESGRGPGSTPDRPTVDLLTVTQTSNMVTTPVEIQASWTAAHGADFYQLQYSYDGERWSTMYEGRDTTASGTVQPGVVYFRVAGFGFLRGPYTQIQKTFNRAATVPVGTGDYATSNYNDRGALEINWAQDPSADYYRVTVSSGSDSLEITTADVGLTISADKITEANGPWSSYDVNIVAVNEQGQSPAGSTSGSIVLGAVTNLTIDNDWEGPEHSVVASWEPLPQFDSYTVQVYVGGVLQETFTVYSPHLVVTPQQVDEYTLARSVEIRVAANAGTIITGLATVSDTDSAPAVPSNITTSSPGTGELDVSWDAVSDSDLRYYRLYASASSGFTPGAATLVYEGVNTSVSLAGLPSGATVYMQLVAVDYIEAGLNYATEFSQVIS